MTTPSDLSQGLRKAVNRRRLVETAKQLISVPSRTGEAGAVSDRLAEILSQDGFTVERPTGGHPTAPAVVVRLDSGRPGPTLQFNGHLDTVHLPFVPPGVEGDNLTGSGSSDMKGGVAVAVEGLRVLRDTGALTAGRVLFTAHDLHEAPWGFGQQLDQLINDGIRGDAVLIPEPLCDRLPVAGRGSATWKVTIRRSGPPIHEVMRPLDEPSVIAAGADLITRLGGLQEKICSRRDPVAGAESVFVGQIRTEDFSKPFRLRITPHQEADETSNFIVARCSGRGHDHDSIEQVSLDILGRQLLELIFRHPRDADSEW